MKPPRQHHYIPRFLLQNWHSGNDDKLTSMRWANGQIVARRFKAQSVAKAMDLYSMARSGKTPDVQIEQLFMGPHIDDAAAPVARKMARRGLREITADDIKAWSPFLISMMLRTPSYIAHMRERGAEVLEATLNANPGEYEQAQGAEPHSTLADFVRAKEPDLFDDLALRALPDIVFSEKLNRAICDSRWAVRGMPEAGHTLLMGDHPLIKIGPFDGSFAMFLPIAPTVLFYLANNDATHQRLIAKPSREMVMEMNRTMIDAAQTYVFGTDSSQRAAVEKYLRPS